MKETGVRLKEGGEGGGATCTCSISVHERGGHVHVVSVCMKEGGMYM